MNPITCNAKILWQFLTSSDLNLGQLNIRLSSTNGDWSYGFCLTSAIILGVSVISGFLIGESTFWWQFYRWWSDRIQFLLIRIWLSPILSLYQITEHQEYPYQLFKQKVGSLQVEWYHDFVRHSPKTNNWLSWPCRFLSHLTTTQKTIWIMGWELL